ncbi:peptide chain release factor N(5)-glutamine methyltransferase [Candidatus Liberibacter asiaticus]|uniref:peptide chain release factor N(5)-glutamine methyltransferase n=1 Tax=Liberibacter asiaticus TaxID=34021 RepID=UPI0012F4B648|nr:peptide chain release factor N(5)-glutamine methyltransferase [Candidatus Liberibacter asiaticus]KAE9510713.1 Release factor glutamine methyltransferase [Candidatus Liberibacter asiaticus]
MSNLFLTQELPHTVAGFLSLIKCCFKRSGLQALRDSHSFLCRVTGLSSHQVIVDPDSVLDDRQRFFLTNAIVRSLKHESIHRILGWRDFYNVRLTLSSDTFEPRPETELLVDSALAFSLPRIEKRDVVRILDLGTGTGAVCLALLKESPFFKGVGVDISCKALEIAKSYAVTNGVSERFDTLQSDWFSSVEGLFDVIVSNPPYIESVIVDCLGLEVRDFDPRISLDGGIDGLSHYRTIADGVSRHLNKDGLCSVEIGYNQKVDVVRIFESRKLFLVNAFKDYGGNDRVLLFCR